MSMLLETLKHERLRLAVEAQKIDKAIVILGGESVLPPTGNSNGNAQRHYRKATKAELSRRRRSRATKKAWATRTPEQRAAWVAAVTAARHG